MQATNFGGTFDHLFLRIFFIKFSQKMPLNLYYTMVHKSQRWPKTQIKGGSCFTPSIQLWWLCRFFFRSVKPVTVSLNKWFGSTVAEKSAQYPNTGLRNAMTRSERSLLSVFLLHWVPSVIVDSTDKQCESITQLKGQQFCKRHQKMLKYTILLIVTNPVTR